MAPASLGAEDAIDADGGDHSHGNGHEVEIAGLIVGIERGEQDEAEKTARDRARDNFREDEKRTPRAAVAGSEMPLAAGTGRHQKQAPSRQESDTR